MFYELDISEVLDVHFACLFGQLNYFWFLQSSCSCPSLFHSPPLFLLFFVHLLTLISAFRMRGFLLNVRESWLLILVRWGTKKLIKDLNEGQVDQVCRCRIFLKVLSFQRRVTWLLLRRSVLGVGLPIFIYIFFSFPWISTCTSSLPLLLLGAPEFRGFRSSSTE